MKLGLFLFSAALGMALIGCHERGDEVKGVTPADASVVSKPSCMSWDGNVCKPLIFALLASPGTYHGTNIELAGYGVWGERSLVVYPTIDMACSQTVATGVELDHAIEISDIAMEVLASNGIVSITSSGVFQSNVNGLSGRYVGHLDDAEVLQVSYSRSSLRVDPRKLDRTTTIDGQPSSVDLPSPVCK